MNVNTSKRISSYLQGQRQNVGMLFIVCLFTSYNPSIPGDPTKHEKAIVPPGVSIPTPDQAQGSDLPLVEELRALALDPQTDKDPEKLAQLGAVLLKLAASKQKAGASHQDLSLYTDAAILYRHVLSICEKKKDLLDSQAASALEKSAYQGLAQVEILMLAQATGTDPGTITPKEPLPARIAKDKQALAALRDGVRSKVDRLVEWRDKQGSPATVRDAEAIFIKDSRELFEAIAKETKSLLANFYQEAEAALGPAPCKYAVIGLGSLALQQITPYSDLEFAILMEEAPDEATAEAWRAYFRKLTHLVHFRVINLGETVLPFSEYEIRLDHLGKKGLNFDLGGKTPLGRKDKPYYDLIQPVEKMLHYLRNEGNKMEHIDKLLPFILECTCYVYGEPSLHAAYQEKQRQFFESQDPAGKHAYQERVMKVLLQGMTELDQSQPGVVKKGRKQAGSLRTVGPKLHPEDAGKLYDVKQEIYRLPDRLLYGLAFYYGILPRSAWDAVEQLQERHIIGVGEGAKQAAHHLKYAVSFATMLRLATYTHYGEQKEVLAGSADRATTEQIASEIFSLPEQALQEDGSLFKYYYTALALHREMEEFFELLHLRPQVQANPALARTLASELGTAGKFSATQDPFYFQSSDFYDTSCAVEVSIYNRLLQYKAAAKCAEKHLNTVKERYFYNHKKLARDHHNLGVTYYHLGKFDQSFDHFRSSLALLQKLYPDGHRQVAKVLRSLGIAHYNLSEFEQSLSYFEQSLKMLQSLYQANHPEIVQALGSVGAAYEQIGKFQESLKYRQQALEMLTSLYQENHPDKASALLSLGDAYAAMGQLEASRDQKEDALAKFQQSLEHKQEALKMFKALYPEKSPEVARALLSLGDAYAAIGQLEASGQHKEASTKNLEESLQHKKASLEKLRALYGSFHPEVARALLSLGETYTARGQLEESIKYKEESLQMFKAFYEDTHTEVVQALSSLNETQKAHRLALGGETPVGSITPFLRPVRRARHQHLALLPTPKQSKEPEGENTLLRNYYRHGNFVYVPSLFDEQRSKHIDALQCQLMLREQSQAASHHKRLEEVRTPIALEDLFKKRSLKPGKPEKETHKILLTGDSGTGKTALSKKLAYQWSQGTWGQEFHALYLLPVRKLQQSEYDGTRYNREKTLATAIVNICFANDLPTKDTDYHRLREHIKEELKKPTTLVILDGLDERAGASQEILSQAQDPSAPHKLLMLSCPYGIDTEWQLANVEIAHCGFNNEQLKAYVLAEGMDDKLSSELLGYIQQHERIRLIAHVPINLQMLCALWKEPDHGAPAALGQDSLAGPSDRFSKWLSSRYTKGWNSEYETGVTAKQLQKSIDEVLQAVQASKDAALPETILQHSQRIEHMLSQLKQTLRQIVTIESLKAREIEYLPNINSYIAFTKLPYFVERTAITKKLTKILQEQGVCILHGFGGAGKSTLAAHYGHERKDTQTVRWTGAEDSRKLREGYEQLAQELRVDYRSLAQKLIADPRRYRQELARAVYGALASNKQTTLLILDNAEDASLIEDYLLHRPSAIQAIITTRSAKDFVGKYDQLQLGPFSQDEGEGYLAVRFKQMKRAYTAHEVASLLEEVGLVAQKLNLAAGYLQECELVTTAQYITRLQALKQAGTKQQGSLRLPQVALGLETLTREGQQLMQYAAYLDADFIPLSLVSVLLGEEDPEQLSEVARDLSRLSLMQVVSTKEGQELGLQIHREVQASCREYEGWRAEAALGTRSTILSKLAEVLEAQMPWVELAPDDRWQQAKLYAPHVATVLKALKDSGAAPSAVVARLLELMGRYSKDIVCNYPEALEYQKQALQIYQDLYQGDHPDVARSLGEVVSSLSHLGNYQEALRYQQKALAMRKRLFEDQDYKVQDHHDLAHTLNSVGELLAHLGKHQEALPYKQEALDIRRLLFKNRDHTDVARSLNSVGTSLEELGNYQEALKYKQEALEIRQRLYPSQDHRDVAHSLNNLGDILIKVGHPKKGVEYCQQALAMRKSKSIYRDQDHHYVAYSLNSVGVGLTQLDEADEGLKYSEEALAMLKRCFPNQDHPYMPPALNNVGMSLIRLNQAEEGIAYQQKALDMLKRLYPDQDHPRMAETLHSMGEALEGLGKLTEAVDHYKQAVVMALRVFKGAHPQLTKYCSHLRETFPKLEETVVQQIKADIRQLCIEVLGEEHALTKDLLAA